MAFKGLFIFLVVLIIFTQERAKRKAGDLSRSGVIQAQNLFFGTDLQEEDHQHLSRRLLNEDEQLDEGHAVPYREAFKLLAELLRGKALVKKGARALWKRIAKEYLKEKKIPEKHDVPVRLLHDSVTKSDILFFANKWTSWMYFDLLKELSMYKDGMTIQEAFKEAETFGLSFQTWRLMKNEEPNFDEGWFENDWWDEEPEEKKDHDWIQEMEEEMRKMREEHERHFKDFDKQFDKEFPERKKKDKVGTNQIGDGTESQDDNFPKEDDFPKDDDFSKDFPDPNDDSLRQEVPSEDI